MSPHLVLPSLLTQCAESLMTVTDAHQVPAALQMLSMKQKLIIFYISKLKKKNHFELVAITQPMCARVNGYYARRYLRLLLPASLQAIDANDVCFFLFFHHHFFFSTIHQFIFLYFSNLLIKSRRKLHLR